MLKFVGNFFASRIENTFGKVNKNTFYLEIFVRL